MTEDHYQTHIKQGNELTEKALNEFDQAGNFEQTWIWLDLAGYHFSSANDLHWQAYLHHQKFQLAAHHKRDLQAYGLAQKTYQLYRCAFDHKGNIRFMLHWAQFLAEQGKLDQALSHLRIAMTLAAKWAPDQLPVIYISLGSEYVEQGAYIDAIRFLNQALMDQSLPQEQETWCLKLLADAFMGLYKPQKAEHLYRKVLQMALDQSNHSLAKPVFACLQDLETSLITGFSTSDLALQAKSQLKSL